MVRLIYCLRRQPGCLLKEFHEHWLEHHVERYGRPLRKIRRYVLYAALDQQPPPLADGVEPYDGIATVWLDDLETLRATMDGAMVEAAEDERRFIDHDRSGASLADDHVVVEPDHPAPIVLFECLRRSGALTADEFSRAWREHAQHARAAYGAGLLSGYIQSHIRADPQGGVDRFDELGAPDESWDGIGAAYFQSAVLARHYLASTGGPPTVGATFVDHERTALMLARRHPQRDLVR